MTCQPLRHFNTLRLRCWLSCLHPWSLVSVHVHHESDVLHLTAFYQWRVTWMKSWWWQDTNHTCMACRHSWANSFQNMDAAGMLQHSVIVSVGAFCFEPCAPSSFWLTHTRMQRTSVWQMDWASGKSQNGKTRRDSVRDTQKSQQVAKQSLINSCLENWKT